jgi:hypothetical protein
VVDAFGIDTEKVSVDKVVEKARRMAKNEFDKVARLFDCSGDSNGLSCNSSTMDKVQIRKTNKAGIYAVLTPEDKGFDVLNQVAALYRSKRKDDADLEVINEQIEVLKEKENTIIDAFVKVKVA